MIKRIKERLKREIKALSLKISAAVLNGTRPSPQKILFIDDCVPHPFLGAGYPRSHEILLALEKMGHAVTFFPMIQKNETPEEVYQDIPRNIEVMSHCSAPELQNFLKKRARHYSLIIISRPPNMAVFKDVISDGIINRKHTRIVYDAEALFAPREALKLTLQGKPMSDQDIENMIKHEISLSAGCDGILSVSSKEKQVFLNHGMQNVLVLKHAHRALPTQNPFHKRQHMLFVGPLYSPDSPNSDAVQWFLNDVFPLIQRIEASIKFIHAGINTAGSVDAPNTEAVQMMGKVDNLSHLYNNARLFVAPTRFAAGVPLKVYEAAGHGLPIVCTSLLAEQLEWENEVDLLVADTPEMFAEQCMRLYNDEALWNRLRNNALTRVGKDCDPEVFYQTLKSVVDGAKES